MSLLPIQKRNAHIPRHHFNSAFNHYTGSSRVKYKAARHPGDNKPYTLTLDLGGEKNTGCIRKMGRRFRQGVCITPNNTVQYNVSKVLSPAPQSNPATLSSTSPPCYHSTANSSVNTNLGCRGDQGEESPCGASLRPLTTGQVTMSGSATTTTSIATEPQLQTLSPLSIVMGHPQGRLSTRRGDHAPPISPAERIWAPSSVDYVAPQQLDAYLGPPPVPQALTHSPTLKVGAPTLQSNAARRAGGRTTITTELMMAMGADASQQPTGILENFDWASRNVVDQGMAQAQSFATCLPPSDAAPTRTTRSRDLPPSCHDKHQSPVWHTHARPRHAERKRHHPYQRTSGHVPIHAHGGHIPELRKVTACLEPPNHPEEKQSTALFTGEATSKPMCRTSRSGDVSLYEAAAECQLIGLHAAKAASYAKHLRTQDIQQMALKFRVEQWHFRRSDGL